MPATKATFTLDDETVARLAELAERLKRSKSAIVREAITDYGERAERLTDEERRRQLAAFDDLVPGIPERPAGEVDAELEELRRARREGGRRGAGGRR